MQAYLMTEPGKIRLSTVPDPRCSPVEVLLSTEVVSICSTDVSYFRGHLTPESWPIIPGHEYVGRVVEVGNKLSDMLQIGDRICYWGQTDFGGMATLRVIRPIFTEGGEEETVWDTGQGFYDSYQSAAVTIPASLPSKVATIVEPLTSVLRTVLTNPPCPGDKCLVLGCGPSGQLAVQVLTRLLAVGPVIVVDRSQRRLGLAVKSGASASYNIDTDATELLRRGPKEFGEVDYVIDALPHISADMSDEDPRKIAMLLMRPGGTYVIYGATDILQRLSTWLILVKGLQLRAAGMDVRLFPMRRTVHVARVALNILAAGLIDPSLVLDNYVDFEDEDAVHRAFASYGEGGSMKTALVARHQ
jgi:L-gulonate 5-dehydrogenase